MIAKKVDELRDLTFSLDQKNMKAERPVADLLLVQFNYNLLEITKASEIDGKEYGGEK